MGTSPDPNNRREWINRRADSIAAKAERMMKTAAAIRGFAAQWPANVDHELVTHLLAGIEDRALQLGHLLDHLEADICFVRLGLDEPEAVRPPEGPREVWQCAAGPLGVPDTRGAPDPDGSANE